MTVVLVTDEAQNVTRNCSRARETFFTCVWTLLRVAANFSRLVHEQANYGPHFLLKPAESETMSILFMNALIYRLSFSW